MSLPRLLFRLALGRRSPTTDGELAVPGLAGPVTVRRDKWGVPHIDAGSDADAWFGLGFCHAQDRGFQLETLLRLARGTLAEMVGPEGLAADRMSRRIGFRRAALEQVPVLAPDVRTAMDAYAAGVNAGATFGVTTKPHEFVLLGGDPTPWDGADVLAFLKLQSFFLPSNWDVELARLRTLRTDGPEAVRALDPRYPEWHPTTIASPPSPLGGERLGVRGIASPQGEAASPGESYPSPGLRPPSPPRGEGQTVLDRLAEDIAVFQRFAPPGGGSNNWAISGSRTLSGKPLLASDPHLGPMIPPPWYLAHVRTPGWEMAGATFAGAPAFPIGHNGFCCWGVTAGLTDTTDLVLETVGPDGRSVREPDGRFVPCPVVREVIRVKGRADVVEDILVTPRGPVVTPVFAGLTEAVSLRAVWLRPQPLRGFLGVQTARDFHGFRRPFAEWPVLPLNVVYADRDGNIGYQLVGDLPRRQAGAHGTLPLPADAPGNAWDAGFVPFDEMPYTVNPPKGFVATANNPPTAPGGGPYVGHDFVDGYRAAAIRSELSRHPVGWAVSDCLKLQTDVRSVPWAEMRDTVLSFDPSASESEARPSGRASLSDEDKPSLTVGPLKAGWPLKAVGPAADDDARTGFDLLRGWDGVAAADSPAAAVFELTVADLSVRVARAKAPKGWAAMVGGDGDGPLAHNLFSDRRVGHLVRLLRERPAGWFPRPWAEEVADAVGAAVRFLKANHGPGPAWWHWGDVRPMVLDHPVLGRQRGLKAVFNRGPVPVGGDQNTVCQAAVRPTDPTHPPHNIPGLRAVFDPADWSNSRFVLAGGQSGNPVGPHYDDLLPLWRAGGGVPIPWTPDEVLRAATAALRLTPASG